MERKPAKDFQDLIVWQKAQQKLQQANILLFRISLLNDDSWVVTFLL